MSAPASARRTAVPEDALVSEALADLRADFDELLFLVRSADASLALAAAELTEAGDRLHARTRATVEAQIRGSRSRYGAAGRPPPPLRPPAGRGRGAAPPPPPPAPREAGGGAPPPPPPPPRPA